MLSPLSYGGAEGEGIEPPPVPPGQRLSKPSHYRSGNLPCAAPTGLEPASPALTRQCSTIELRHPVYCVPGEGFEPPSFRLWTGRLFRWASRAGVEQPGVEPGPSGLQGETVHQHLPHRLTVPSARFERAPCGPSDRCLYRWATRALTAPKQGFEPRSRDSESRVLPVRRPGNECGWPESNRRLHLGGMTCFRCTTTAWAPKSALP